MSDERDEIKARVSIVDLVGQTVALKRTGKTWKGLCPFHDDRNPSFTVSESTGRYTCWACGEKGDIFNWVMKTQNVEFPEALKILAARAGITLKLRSGERSKSQRELHEAIMAEACAFFSTQLDCSDTAKAYLEGRGLDKEAVRSWELGYAPDVDIALGTHLKKKGMPLNEAKALFLVDSDPGGGFFDKFRGRLMFPIRDERGDLVAFGGRILGEGHPKYINSGDTPLFRKSRVLYGMHRAKEHIANAGKAVLVEGYLDVIACHRAGVCTAVASLGTSLTEDHAKMLKRWCEEVVVFYDADAAGQKAAERALEVLSEAGNRVRIALLPDGQDPDTLFRSAGPAAVARAADASVSPLEFRIAVVEASMKPDQDEFWHAVVAALASSPSLRAVQQEATRLVQKHLSGRNGEGAVSTLLHDVQRAKHASVKGRKTARPPDSQTAMGSVAVRKVLATEGVVFNAVLLEDLRTEVWPLLAEVGLFQSPEAVELAGSILAVLPEPPKGPPIAWLDKIESEEARAALASFEDPMYLASRESLAMNLAMLRRARESRRAAVLASDRKGDEDLADIMASLKASRSE